MINYITRIVVFRSVDLTLLYNAFYQLSFFVFSLFFFKMATNFLDLATTLENLGARWLLEKKVNFVPWFNVFCCQTSW